MFFNRRVYDVCRRVHVCAVCILVDSLLWETTVHMKLQVKSGKAKVGLGSGVAQGGEWKLSII